MRLGKRKISAVLGMMFLFNFILLSIFHDFLFTKELIACSFIIGLVLLIRFIGNEPGLRSENNEIKIIKSSNKKSKSKHTITTSLNCSFSPVIQKVKSV